MEDNYNPSRGNRETLSWLIEVLYKASEVRLKFYRQQQKVAEESTLKIEMDPPTGAVIQNADPYCAAHTNLIFLTNQIIEGFHGTLTAAYYLSGKKPELAKVCSILLNPKDVKGGIISKLRKGTLSPKAQTSVMAIPRIDISPEPDRSDLNRMFSHCFQRFEICTKYSFEYADTFKPVRNAYAHNYRFIFYRVSAPPSKPQFDESSLGLLPENLEEVSTTENELDATDLMKDMIYVGFLQRLATGKLVTQLTMFERWIFMNMRSMLWNHDIPVLPENVPYLPNNETKRYAEIRATHNYNLSIPRRNDYGNYDKEKQENLHKIFLFELQSLGDQFKMKDQHGREIPLKFLDKEGPLTNNQNQ